MNKELIAFSVEDAKIIDTNEDSNFAIVSLDFFASGPNLHALYVSEETLERTADTIKRCPLVWAYDKKLDDAYTHTPDEVPCGFVPETSTVTPRTLDDGRKMLSVVAYVWKRYTGDLLKFFKRDGGKKPVSVEMSVLKTRLLPNGKIELLDFRYECITILGTNITPAIPNAEARVLSFSELEQAYKDDFEKEFSTTYFDLYTGKRVGLQKKSEELMNKEEDKRDVFTKDETKNPLENEVLENSEEVNDEKTEILENQAAETEGEKEEGNEEPKVEAEDSPDFSENESEGTENSEEDQENGNLDTESDEEKSTTTKDLEEALATMSAKIDEMTKTMEALTKENEELKKFKANVEESQKQFTIEQTIRELEEKVIIPEDAKANMIESAKTYAFSDISEWKTLCKAQCFEFEPRVNEENTNNFTKVGLPFADMPTNKKKDLWQ